MPGNRDSLIEDCLGQLATGDDSARHTVLELVSDRLYRLTRVMFHQFPALRSWEETPDIHQRAMLRLYQALGDIHPDNSRQLFNLAALQVKRILIDLARHYSGANERSCRFPMPLGNHHGSHVDAPHEPRDDSSQPGTLDNWTAFHEGIDALPEQEREVAMLIFYDGLGQEEVAALLNVSVRTVKRLWQSAKMILRRSMEHSDAP